MTNVYVLDVLPALVAHGYKGRARAFSELTNDELEHLAAKTAICCRQNPLLTVAIARLPGRRGWPPGVLHQG